MWALACGGGSSQDCRGGDPCVVEVAHTLLEMRRFQEPPSDWHPSTLKVAWAWLASGVVVVGVVVEDSSTGTDDTGGTGGTVGIVGTAGHTLHSTYKKCHRGKKC